MTMTVKYPEVKVRLVGEDGNAFAIIGRTERALRKAKVPAEEIAAYRTEAMSGDYEHLLRVTMQTVDTSLDDDENVVSIGLGPDWSDDDEIECGYCGEWHDADYDCEEDD